MNATRHLLTAAAVVYIALVTGFAVAMCLRSEEARGLALMVACVLVMVAVGMHFAKNRR